jgi:GntR family transcriptional regulator
LRLLESEGLVAQQAGRGTFVAPPQLAYQLDTLRSLEEDLRAQGVVVTTEVLGCALRRAPGDLPGAVSALRLERVRRFAGRPAVHQVSWVSPPYAERLRGLDFTTTSLYAALADLGVTVSRATERIRPGLLAEPALRHLAEPAGSPVLHSDRTTYGLDGATLVLDRATILGSRMEIHAERAASGVRLAFTVA